MITYDELSPLPEVKMVWWKPDLEFKGEPVLALIVDSNTLQLSRTTFKTFDTYGDLFEWLLGKTVLVACPDEDIHMLLKGCPARFLKALLLCKLSVPLGDYWVSLTNHLIVRRGNRWGRIFNLEPNLRTAGDPYSCMIEEGSLMGWPVFESEATLLVQEAAKAGIPLSAMSSFASAGQAYFMRHSLGAFCSVPQEVQEAFWACTKSGRMETEVIGHKPGDYWDMTDAYGGVLAELPSLSTIEWIHSRKRLRNAYYGALRCRVRCGGTWGPIAVIIMGLGERALVSPVGEFECSMTLQEYEVARKAADIEILDAWWGVTNNPLYLFREAEKEIFSLRSNPILYRFAKRAPQGFVGKMGSIYIRYNLQGEIICETSPIFNAVYLATIRGTVRSVVWKALMGSSGFATRTDGVMTTSKEKLVAGQLTVLGFRHVGEENSVFLTDNFKSSIKSRIDWLALMEQYSEFPYVEVPMRSRLGISTFRSGEPEECRERLGSIRNRSRRVRMGSARRLYVDEEPRCVGDLLGDMFETRAPRVDELPAFLLAKFDRTLERYDEQGWELGFREKYLT